MKNYMRLGLVLAIAGGAFIGGVAVGQGKQAAKYVARDEVKFDDLGGPKLGALYGDYKKGAYGGLFQMPGGFTSPLHTHSGAYEAVQIEGTSMHWLKGEDMSKAKKMTPGSYWTMPGKLEHFSMCMPGKDCVVFVWQKGKFDFTDKTPKDAAKPAGAGSGSAAKPTK